MSAITIRIPDSLHNDLNVVAKFQDKPKSRVIKRALENYILVLNYYQITHIDF